ncbi:thiamine-phosphate kinase [Homoserinibacter sp. GY 40078]|uniref:thiamine-phosphate kinase n=1 Tax=Homoserinibacter sp. GY 40078 TaxID=2603275 RepID=UPI0011CA2B29|nr:thiamine-phosphate kinase [Homoserinibacter sp. GY 40078]TXK16411.1 thiamine-phosphate kinase [Homoserinibacter sp. GY 40078]
MPAPDETLGSLGEAAILRRIFPRLPHGPEELLGPGDDAAVLAAPDGRVVVTTDTLVHGPDFRHAWSSPFQLGWKSAAVNLADIAAMGARPTGLVVALVAPSSTTASWIERLADGFREACAALAPGCGVVGGDLSVSETLMVAVTAFGDLGGRSPVLRSGARPGDVVAVCGELGLAGAGLALLFAQGVDDEGTPDAKRAAALRPAHDAELDAQLAPSPPIAAGVTAAEAGATAMMDVSDGLVLDARRLAEASGVVLDLSSRAVGSRDALVGGEDHALLATFPADAPLPSGFREIGRVQEATDVAELRVDGRAFDGRGGWDPYEDWDGAVG